jgi:hypothetical protein
MIKKSGITLQKVYEMTVKKGIKLHSFNIISSQNENTEKGLLIKFDIKTDNSVYPVFFLIEHPAKGLESTFKWRSGGLEAPIIISGKITNSTRIYLPFFFELEWLLDQYGLLLGECFANRPPMKSNKQLDIYFDKLAFFCFEACIKNIVNSYAAQNKQKNINNDTKTDIK